MQMLGWFKPKMAPEGPVTLEYEIEIDVPASELYPLIDFADPRNSKRQSGETVREVPGRDGAFELVLATYPDLTDLTFDIQVTESVPNEVYAFDGKLPEGPGALIATHERYEIEAVSEHACLLRLIVDAKFRFPMKLKVYKQEVAKMMMAVHNACAKLKLHAEQGTDAVHAVHDHVLVNVD
ncbi:hypothetical protein GCM10010989_12920 [Croceicoccus pelagius]|uniref:Polyketide cyclase / dehydrase and lipid transport n=2 Tax=Croceicoccus pelagius TaxID=1703341 RepID=A0A916YCK7_9SPHN|nr:hypothetical protein GCM10010989_12920 [Croceicoccus pelagius]